MDIFRKKEKESILYKYSDYNHVGIEHINLRNITGDEFDAIDKRYRSKHLVFTTKPGIALLLSLLFTISSLKYCADLFLNGEKEPYIPLMIFGSVDLFAMVFSVLAVRARLDRMVTPDSLVAAGEVLESKVVRGPKNSIRYADHTIAFHSTREIVTFRYYKPIYAGTTVLIVKSPKMTFHLIPISADEVEMNYSGKDHSAEISERSIVNIGDLSEYSKTPFTAVRKHYLSRDEFLDIPKKYRSVSPFSRGLASGSWVFFTLITIIMCGLLAKFIGAHDMGKAFPLSGGIFCVMIIEIFLTGEVFRTPLKLGRTYSIDCVVIRKEKFSGQCIVSIILPDTKQYVDNIRVDPMIFDSIVTNTNVRLYFHMKYTDAKYISEI